MSDRYQRLRSSVDALADRDGYETARDVRALLSERDELVAAGNLFKAYLEARAASASWTSSGDRSTSGDAWRRFRDALANAEGRQGGED